jgi:hypothetical protein
MFRDGNSKRGGLAGAFGKIDRQDNLRDREHRHLHFLIDLTANQPGKAVPGRTAPRPFASREDGARRDTFC